MAADAPAAEARDTAAPAPTPRRRAVVFCACETESEEKLHASLTELLRRLGVDLEWRRVPAVEVSGNVTFGNDQVAVAWVDTSASNVEITIGFRRPNQASLTLVKRQLERQDGAPLALEAASHVLHAAIEDILAAEKADADALAAAAAAEKAAAAKQEPPKQGQDAQSGIALDLGAAFGGRAFGSDAPFVFGGGAFAKLGAGRGMWHPALTFTGVLHIPSTIEGPLVQVQFQTLALRLLPSLTLVHGKSFMLEAGIGGGVDVFFASPRSSIVPASVLRHGKVDAAPVLTAAVTGRIPLAESADVFVSLGVDADLAPPRYVTETANVYTELFSPGRVRPYVLVGFALTAFGPKPYAQPAGATP